MRVAIGSDHRGVAFRARVREELRRLGAEVLDLGVEGAEPADYPDLAEKVARAVASGQADRGVVACGTGIGVSIAANKVRGIRAAVAHDVFTAERSRSHNDANVLCLGAEVVREEDLPAILRAWFTTPFEGGRHSRRVQKIADIESRPS